MTHVFLPQESQTAHFRQSLRFSRTPPIRSWAPTWGIPRFRVPGPLQTANSTSTVWSSRRLLLPYSIGLQGHQVMVTMDNSTVVSYINKQGGTCSLTLLRLSVDLFLWLESQSIIVRARHIPAPRDRESYLQGLGDTRSRHVCDTVELPPSSVHVSSSGAKSPCGGCSVSRLAGEVNVHVSPIPHAQQGHAETMVHSGGGGDPCSPLVAVSVVVSTSTTSLCGTPSDSPLPSGSSQQDQKYISDGKSYHLHI